MCQSSSKHFKWKVWTEDLTPNTSNTLNQTDPKVKIAFNQTRSQGSVCVCVCVWCVAALCSQQLNRACVEHIRSFPVSSKYYCFHPFPWQQTTTHLSNMVFTASFSPFSNTVHPPSPCRCVPTMHLWVRTSPGECGRHLLVRCLLCPGWFSSVDVKHLWHVEDALTGPLVPESLFLTDPQNSYFFKSPLRRQRMNNRVAQSGSSFFCCRRRKCRHWWFFHLI